jgi:predicted permease
MARGLRVSLGFIAGLGARAELGRMLVADDYTSSTQPPVVIGQALWRERFASDPNVIGRELRVDVESRAGARESFRIVGVLPASFWFGRDSREKIDMLVPLTTAARSYMIRLRDGVAPAEAERRLTAAAREIGSAFPANWPGVKLESVHARYTSGMRATLRAVMYAAALVLLITCTNVAVLTMLRAVNRQREMAVRLALGAGRRELLAMFLVEGGIVGGGALLLGVFASMALLRVLSPVISAQLGKPAPGGPQGIGVDSAVIAAAIAIGIVMTMMLAAVSMIAPSVKRIPDMLCRTGRATTDAPATRRLRAAFVTLEIAGSLALLVGGALMVRSAMGMLSSDLGFRAEGLLRTRIVLRGGAYPDAASYERFYETLTARLSELSPSAPAFSSSPPYGEPPAQPIAREDSPSAETGAPVIAVSPGFFSTLGIGVADGREFSAGDRSTAEPVAVVSRTLARRLWPGASPVGQRIHMTRMTGRGPVVGPWRRVVGVVGDVKQTYDDDNLANAYIPYAQGEFLGRYGSFYLRTDRSPAAAAASMRQVLASIDPLGIVNDPRPVIEENVQLSRARFMTSMLAGFATFALLVALLGVYGVVAYAVQQREREVAIRIALGATARSVVRLFVSEGGRMIVGGLALGSAAAVGVGRLIQSQLIGVAPLDAAAFAIAYGLVIAAGIGAVWWPARRAASVAPMQVLNDV